MNCMIIIYPATLPSCWLTGTLFGAFPESGVSLSDGMNWNCVARCFRNVIPSACKGYDTNKPCIPWYLCRNKQILEGPRCCSRVLHPSLRSLSKGHFLNFTWSCRRPRSHRVFPTRSCRAMAPRWRKADGVKRCSDATNSKVKFLPHMSRVPPVTWSSPDGSISDSHSSTTIIIMRYPWSRGSERTPANIPSFTRQKYIQLL